MTVQFISADYNNFAIGSACRMDVVDGKLRHEESFFVWTRDKDPSMYMRRKMRNTLLELGAVPEKMVKGPNVQCWGEDYFPQVVVPFR